VTAALDDVVTTPRLRLELITPDEAAGMLAGRRRPSWHPDYPRRDDLDAISMIAKPTGPSPAPDLSWSPRHVVRAFDGLVVGSIGFFGPPSEAPDGVSEVEIGYGLVEDARGHGSRRPTGSAYACGRASLPTTPRACGCWPSADSRSCAAPTRTATW
jgi:hypothetical protein